MKTVVTIAFWSLMLVGGILLAPVALVALACGMDIDAAANAASNGRV